MVYAVLNASLGSTWNVWVSNIGSPTFGMSVDAARKVNSIRCLTLVGLTGLAVGEREKTARSWLEVVPSQLHCDSPNLPIFDLS